MWSSHEIFCVLPRKDQRTNFNINPKHAFRSTHSHVSYYIRTLEVCTRTIFLCHFHVRKNVEEPSKELDITILEVIGNFISHYQHFIDVSEVEAIRKRGLRTTRVRRYLCFFSHTNSMDYCKTVAFSGSRAIKFG